jgi:RNA polymerase sigma-70 factor (ECF subfamily)
MTKEQFLQIYHLYVDAVARFLSYYTKDKFLLEDLLQEVFIKLWKYKNSIDPENPHLKTYVLKTARNVALSHFEDKKKDPVEIREKIIQKDKSNVLDQDLDIHDLNTKYRKALKAAPNKARNVYLMNREEGLTYREIAGVLEISPRTVEVHISKVLSILRRELKEFKY